MLHEARSAVNPGIQVTEASLQKLIGKEKQIIAKGKENLILKGKVTVYFKYIIIADINQNYPNIGEI